MCVRPILIGAPTAADVLRGRGSFVPCGHCIECRLKHRRSWSVRCMHEESLHDASCFVTLTKADGMFPHGSCSECKLVHDRSFPSLCKREFILFMKRLRLELAPKKVRVFHVGEYGDRSGRPHHHFLLFGHMFGDRTVLKDTASGPLWRSGELEALWTGRDGESFGMSSVGRVSSASAAYVAGYVLKKVDQVGKKKKYSCDSVTGELHEIVPEYATMSRRPGIGRGWYDKYSEEVVRLESVRVDGAELSPPRYYDELLRQRDAAAYEVMKLRRERKSKEYWSGKDQSEKTRESLAREVIARKRLEEATRRLV